MRKSLSLILIALCMELSAQEAAYRKQWKLDIMAGANIDFPHTSCNPAASLLSNRDRCVPVWNLRLSHLFAPRFGWYADLKIRFYDEHYDNTGTFEDIMTALAKSAFAPVAYIRPSLNAGMLYRIESRHWHCYPRLGMGINLKNRRETDGKGYHTYSNGTALCAEAGISAHYMLSQRMSLLLDVSYQQPVTKAKASVTRTADDVTTKSEYRTSTFGRELSISAGIGIHL